MPKKILVVDDEAGITLTLSSRLRANGFEVLSAADGLQGLDLAKKEKPDLIILDLMLPKMDGYKVCGILKRDARYSKIPIILFSAKALEEDRKLGREVGADAYITKPYRAGDLLEKIGELLKENP